MVKTEVRWPRKLESAKERVTTQLSNHIALKMDDAKEVLEMVQKRNKIIEIEIYFF